MALKSGNVVADPSAQTFISVVDADSYLAPEGNATWDAMEQQQKENVLVQASRWISYSFHWCDPNSWGKKELDLLGIATARLATENLSRNIWVGKDERGPIQMVKAGTVQIQWQGTSAANRKAANGKYWPWLESMLTDLICEPHGGLGVMVV